MDPVLGNLLFVIFILVLDMFPQLLHLGKNQTKPTILWSPQWCWAYFTLRQKARSTSEDSLQGLQWQETFGCLGDDSTSGSNISLEDHFGTSAKPCNCTTAFWELHVLCFIMLSTSLKPMSTEAIAKGGVTLLSGASNIKRCQLFWWTAFLQWWYNETPPFLHSLAVFCPIHFFSAFGPVHLLLHFFLDPCIQPPEDLMQLLVGAPP